MLDELLTWTDEEVEALRAEMAEWPELFGDQSPNPASASTTYLPVQLPALPLSWIASQRP
jgi:hypothetical protein